MKQTNLIDEGATEYTTREPRTEQERQHHARAKQLQTKMRLQALERLPSDPARLERLRSEPGRAAALLRWALSENESDARAVPLAVRAVIAAYGSLESLDLSREELMAMVRALDKQPLQLAQAA